VRARFPFVYIFVSTSSRLLPEDPSCLPPPRYSLAVFQLLAATRAHVRASPSIVSIDSANVVPLVALEFLEIAREIARTDLWGMEGAIMSLIVA